MDGLIDLFLLCVGLSLSFQFPDKIGQALEIWLTEPVFNIDYSARPARPGATHLSVVGLDDATHQTWFFATQRG